MAKTRTIFLCQQCGSQQTRWMGKCPDCGTWDSLVEQAERKEPAGKSRGGATSTGANRPTPLREIAIGGFTRLPVLGDEFGRVLGGGIVPGSLVLIGGEPGIGKCVVGNTRVLDPRTGDYLPITDWQQTDRAVLGLNTISHQLRPACVTAFHDNGIRPTVEIRTRLGRHLQCTPSHPVLTPVGWREVGGLHRGDRIASPRALPYFGNETMPDAEVKLIAYILSDSDAQSSVHVTTALPEVAADLQTVADHFGMTLRCYRKRGNRAATYRFVVPPGQREAARQEIAGALRSIHGELGGSWTDWAQAACVSEAMLNMWRRAESAPSADELRRLAEAAGVPLERLAPDRRDQAEMTTPVARLLQQVSLRHTTAATKVVPEAIFRLEPSKLTLFLKILFTCDGSIYVSNRGIAGISYTTISRRLAEDVQHLLLRFGFIAQLRTKRLQVRGAPYTAFELQVLGSREVKRFLSEIGILGRAEAKARLETIQEPRLPSTHFDTVPTEANFWGHVRELVAGVSYTQMSREAGVVVHPNHEDRPLCRSTVVALANTYPSTYLQALAHGDIYWDEIESIVEAAEAPVYDITVPAHANFVANDLIVHNSTLLAQAAAKFADEVGPALYVSAEESGQQIKLRAARMGLDPEHLLIYSETSLDAILEQITQIKPRLVIVDSIQTVYLEDVTSAAGSVSQVREGAMRLLRAAKDSGIPMFLVGHVTKEGAIAGPRVLEHIVDVVLYLEGERFHQYRLLRGVKNRFGSTDEVGVFEMTQLGLKEVPNPSQVFLAERSAGTPGSAVAVTMEGTRPILVEVQALTSNTASPQPRRTANGFDMNRLQMLIAVLSKRVGLPLFNQDVYVNIVGGLRIGEPAADLAVAVAIASSFRNQRVRQDAVLVGEVGLSGELRSVGQLERRLSEAAKLGFSRAYLPVTGAALRVDGLSALETRSLAEAVDQALEGRAQRPPTDRRRPTTDDQDDDADETE